jgi:hypothetical protein
MSASGIANYFSNTDFSIVDAVVCHSMAFASAFNSFSYYGYQKITCAPNDLQDQELLWNRLTGHFGTDLRDTISAQKADGFSESPCPCLGPNAYPVVLSPAVTSVTGTGADPNWQYTVKFDADMEAGAPVFTSSGAGCIQVTSGPTWLNAETLQFSVTDVDPGAQGSLSATLPASAFSAVPIPGSASGTGTYLQLDGNTNPPNTNGQEPNGDDYDMGTVGACTQQSVQPGGGG